ncbi:DUF1206 domain-containing protein [Salinarimonas soli]|uniref:DUF1206 domain-containing protein n=1 Tax=Salinarimonas soli TaxID=1638099 RepID=A0A5B2VE45_9HYPH|nr:DUF1206 domain-containing protein [Salinarimonas soli]KAA2236906.1 DUF1206 domain-containing protein [Salinarimonas soli]
MPRRGSALEIAARLGFGARGVVYCLVGGLALLAAFGAGGQTGGSRNALRSLLDQPFGRALLGAVALGLACFAAWQAIAALLDADRHGTSAKGLAVRAGQGLGGAINAGLALSALSLALGWGSGGGPEDQAARDWTAWLMTKPFGQWLVGLVGVAVAGTGLVWLWKAWRGKVLDRLSLPADARPWAQSMGRLGFAARGVVFVIIGGFVVAAALHSNSREVQGLGGALRTLETQPYGWALLGLTAAGLLAFGIFGFVQARYRRIDPPEARDAARAIDRGIDALRR